jgi:hypothetical protein
MLKLKEAILPISLRTWLDAMAHNLDTASDNAAALLPKLAEAGRFGLGVPALQFCVLSLLTQDDVRPA